MTTWLERNLIELEDWNLSSTENACKEVEMAYLFNDIGPLIYVQGLAAENRAKFPGINTPVATPAR